MAVTSPGPVLVLGAGATRACGGPLTDEILDQAFSDFDLIEREGYLSLLDQFLMDVFRLPPRGFRTKTSYPGLPLLLSLIDTAIDRNQPLHSRYSVSTLRDVRASLEYAIFAVLEYRLRQQIPPLHSQAIDKLFAANAEPRIISLNYDIIADNMLAFRSQSALPEYNCDVRTATYQRLPKFGQLCKLHGSLNWLFCPNCNRLDVAVSRSGHSFSKALEELFISEGSESNDLEQRFTCHGSPCADCGTFVRPIMITPTQRKDYRNPHIMRVWYQAEQLLRAADSVVFIGYSMPSDDVDVVYLFKRGLEHLPASQVTVVEFDPLHRTVDGHDVGLRYQSVFGAGIRWYTDGFAGWLAQPN